MVIGPFAPASTHLSAKIAQTFQKTGELWQAELFLENFDRSERVLHVSGAGVAKSVEAKVEVEIEAMVSTWFMVLSSGLWFPVTSPWSRAGLVAPIREEQVEAENGEVEVEVEEENLVISSFVGLQSPVLRR